MFEWWMLRTQDLLWDLGCHYSPAVAAWCHKRVKPGSWGGPGPPALTQTCISQQENLDGLCCQCSRCCRLRLHSKEKPKTKRWSERINHCQGETAAVKHVRLYQTSCETPLVHAAAIDLSEILNRSRRQQPDVLSSPHSGHVSNIPLPALGGGRDTRAAGLHLWCSPSLPRACSGQTEIRLQRAPAPGIPLPLVATTPWQVTKPTASFSETDGWG